MRKRMLGSTLAAAVVWAPLTGHDMIGQSHIGLARTVYTHRI